MAARGGSLLWRPWRWPAVWREGRLVVRLLREPSVPMWTKLVLPVALLYVLSPVDFLPDVIPGLGQIDDLVLLFAAVKLFVRFSPPDAVGFHRDAIARRQRFRTMSPADTVIDAEFKRS